MRMFFCSVLDQSVVPEPFKFTHFVLAAPFDYITRCIELKLTLQITLQIVSC